MTQQNDALVPTQADRDDSDLQASVKYLLDREPLAVRVHEGNSVDENLAASISITMLKMRAAIEGRGEETAIPQSEAIQAWIAAAYREPEAQAQLDSARFTRWNMEVAYAAGFREASRLAHPAAPASELVEEVVEAMNAWTSGEQNIKGEVWVHQRGKRVASFKDSDSAYAHAKKLNAEAAIAIILRARDAEVAAWLRNLPLGSQPPEAAIFAGQFADAIEAGEVGRA